MSDKLTGKTLAGRFVLEEVLGTGATGAVYRAQQTSVDRVVAVKTLHAFLQEREDFKARFEIEAKAIARLNHPNCITLYDFGYDEGFDVFYMAVEYIKGVPLAEMMTEDIALEDVLSISYQVAEALDHAHREGILHRDLKPENIMIQEMPGSGRYAVKVLDFGLARLYEPSLDDDDEAPSGRYQQITQAGQVYGTPAYMSPEQCRAKEELTPATDLYALGTMMFELLQGRLPFFSKSTAELILMQMTEEPPKMDRLDVPAEIRNIIHRMMAKDPAERPQSAKEVLICLLAYVRIDASQEFRILPTASGEFAQLTPEQERVISQLTGSTTTQERIALRDLELSNDELKSAVGSGRTPVMVAAVLVVIAVVLVSVVLTGSGPGDEADVKVPVAVDSAAAHVADSPAPTGGDAAAEDPVEVAKNTGGAEEEEKPRKRLRRKKSAAAKKKASSSKDDTDTKAGTDRPKTLKLTY